MSDSTFAEILAAAEKGEARFPVVTKADHLETHEKLERAKQILFGEADGLDAHFATLTDLPPGSPFAPKARRLRLLRKHRAGLKKVFEGDNPLASPLYATLAEGPGPTMAKRRFADRLNTPAAINSASSLRRSLSEKAFDVYREERDWLKQVGPSRQRTGPGFLARIDFKTTALVLVSVIGLGALFVAIAAAGGSSGSGGGIRFPLAIIIWPAVLLYRAFRSK